jgi:hypothetical protein
MDANPPRQPARSLKKLFDLVNASFARGNANVRRESDQDKMAGNQRLAAEGYVLRSGGEYAAAN